MPGPIFLSLTRYPTTDCAIVAPRPDPANLAAYGISRPHENGKMAPPEKHVYPDVWAKKRKR